MEIVYKYADGDNDDGYEDDGDLRDFLKTLQVSFLTS